MKLQFHNENKKRRKFLGFSLEEVVVSLGIASMTISGLISGQVLAYKRALWTAASQAAQNKAMQRLEQTRGALWDTKSVSGADELVTANFPTVIETLQVPLTTTNVIYATNTTTITTISASPPLKMVQVDVVWSCLGRGVFTNSVFTYRSADQ